MNRTDVFRQLIGDRTRAPAKSTGRGVAPANIALCKYWGKRDDALNLPVTASLSISLGPLGTETEVSVSPAGDTVTLNGASVPADAPFARRLLSYLEDALGPERPRLQVATRNSIPTAAGLASSASGFAALVRALDDLFDWRLDHRSLSILARLGSGSAARSLFHGFVEWHAGARADGMDSFAERLPVEWPDFRVGLLTVSAKPKEIGSRDAMKRTVRTSPLYAAWPEKVAADLETVRDAIAARDFDALGRAAESNALTMHATSLGAWPPVLFWLPESVERMRQVWSRRADGWPVYFTMDAGPNLKLIFLARHEASVAAAFPDLAVVAPFGG